MIKWYNIEQNTDEWLDMRIGKVGGSAIASIMANYGKAFGPPAHDIAVRIALEKITGKRQESTYSNDHMQRGHEEEPIARMLYSDQTFSEVANGGYFTDGDLIGISPDGIVDFTGLIEVKSVIAKVHYATVKRGTYDPKYKWQLYYNLKNSKPDIKWIDYVELCSAFPENKKLFIQRIVKGVDTDSKFEMIDIRMEEFRGLIDQKIETINNI